MHSIKFYSLSVAIVCALSAHAYEYDIHSFHSKPAVKESVKHIMERPEAPRNELRVKPHRKVRAPAKSKTTAIDTPSLDFNSLTSLPESYDLRVGTPQTIGLNFLGTFYAENLVVPADAEAAVGPTQLLVVPFERVKSFNKATGTLDGVVDTSSDNFFASVIPAGASVGDIRALFDPHAHRFIILARTVPTSSEVILIAVSDSDIITSATSFLFYAIPTAEFTPLEVDFPSLGVDLQALYSGFNLFTSTYINSAILVVQKASLLSGGPLVLTYFGNINNGSTGQVSPQAVTTFDTVYPYGVVIGTNVGNDSEITYQLISNPGSTSPTLSSPLNIAVSPTDFGPVDAPAPGSIAPINTGDNRLNWSTLRNKQLWTCNTSCGCDDTGSSTGTITRTGIRWYELNFTSPLAALVTQFGTLFDPNPSTTDQLYYFFGSVMSSGQGHMALSCTNSGTTAYLNACISGRLATDPTGTLDGVQNFTDSDTSYNLQSTPQRWGDYSTVWIDCNDNMTMWAATEYCNATNSWGVQVAQLIAPPPATPTSVSPASVAYGQSLVTVQINGQSTNGSGFYDPGVLFPNRLNVFITGKVDVKAIRYINPTTIEVDIDTTQATIGTHDIVVTNPDLQQITGSGLLTVTCP